MQVRAVDHSRACCWQNRKTPGLVPSRCVPMRYRCCWNGPRATLVGALRKSERLTRAREATRPAPALLRYVLARTRAAASGFALIASTTCLAVELGAPLA